jgi:hypothetical protein
MDEGELDIPQATAKVVELSIKGPSSYGAHMTAEQRRANDAAWREDLERFWRRVRQQAGSAYPEALQHLDLVGAREGFTSPVTGRRMRLDSSSSALLALLG